MKDKVMDNTTVPTPEISFWSSFSASCLYRDLVKEWLENSKKTKEPS